MNKSGYKSISSGDGRLLCNQGGGSPSMHTVQSRITSLLVTVRGQPYRCYYGLNFVNLIDTYRAASRRVEQSTPEGFSKVYGHHRFFLTSPLQTRDMLILDAGVPPGGGKRR
ncbi:hypothetical protein ACFL27_02395 [candidate division CSSED10-310 bacterium]|uniref:Uncharacterized protein n=1 Tax=candidate division CSSED10-310 bacterium TaxID=2855610 RepID=A0ABV6YSA9_UNCC1